MAKGKSSKDKLKEIAVEAITLQGPMTNRQISDYAIDNHKAVRWIPHRLVFTESSLQIRDSSLITQAKTMEITGLVPSIIWRT